MSMIPDIDMAVVALAVSGERRVRLTPAEQAAAWRQLEAEGATDEEIAVTLGVSRKIINRWQAGANVTGRVGMAIDALEPVTKGRTIVSTADFLIDEGLKSRHPRVRSAARACKTTLETLREVTKDEDAKEKIRIEIADKERELAAVKAKLKTPSKRYHKGLSFNDVWEWHESNGGKRRRGHPGNILIGEYKKAKGLD